MADFRSLLAQPLDDIKRPVALPAGTYYGVILSYSYGESQQKKTPYVRYIIRVTEAGEDIDQESLEGIELQKKQLRRDFYFTEDAKYRLKDFISSCGIQTEGRSFSDTIPETINCEVMLSVTQRMVTKEGSTEAPEAVNDVASMVGRQ